MARKHLIYLFAWLASVLAPPSTAIDLGLMGSNTIGAELAPALAKAWMQQQGYGGFNELREGNKLFLRGVNSNGAQLLVEVDAQGSSTGFKALVEKRTDVGMSSRPITAAEVNTLKPMGRCDTAACEYVLALDGIAIVVNSKNPVGMLDVAALRGIFSGQIRDWKQVGGSAGPIRLYALDNESGTYDTFRHLVLGDVALDSGAKRDASHMGIARMVAADANGIGFVGLPFIGDNKALAVKEEGTRAISPTPFAVATEDYVLARRLFFYMPESRVSDVAGNFMNFSVSDAGQKIVAQTGFVSQQIQVGTIALDETAPDEYRQLTDGAQRLSLNFRFVEGMATLDNKSQRDIERLIQFMRRSENRGKKLMLFGFADSNESMPIVSLQLSMDRADTISDLLSKSGVQAIKVRGYGSVAAVASNATPEGRYKNRRVEVWMR